MNQDSRLELMPEFVPVAYTDTLRPGECKVVRAGDHEIALYNVEGHYYATDNACAHKDGPLGDGTLNGRVITCPWHTWEFDVITGENLNNPSVRVACFEVRVSGERIQVKI